MTTDLLGAESAVIGSILVDPKCLRAVAETLNPADFVSELNRAIYKAALALDRAGKSADPVLIRDEARRQGADVSTAYLLELMDTTPTAANVEEYARLVREGTLKRGILAMCEGCRTMLEHHTSAHETLDAAGEMLEGLREREVEGELITPMEGLKRFGDHLDAVATGTAKAFVSTGYRDIDNILGGGMLSGGMYVLAARPGMGKTTLALNIADRVAAQSGAVLFVSLEMDVEQLNAKRVARLSGIPGNRLLMQRLTDQEYAKAAQAQEKLYKLPMYINLKPSATVNQIETMARKVKDLSLIVVDYLGIISPGDRGKASRYEYTTEISGALKQLARKFRRPVLALAQLNRENEARKDHRPQLSDLRDTGAIEQDADGVIFLHRPSYYGVTKDPYAPEVMEVNVAKNRHGPVGMCELAFGLSASKVTAVSNDPRRVYRESQEFKQAIIDDKRQEASGGEQAGKNTKAAGKRKTAPSVAGPSGTGAGSLPPGGGPGAGDSDGNYTVPF